MQYLFFLAVMHAAYSVGSKLLVAVYKEARDDVPARLDRLLLLELAKRRVGVVVGIAAALAASHLRAPTSALMAGICAGYGTELIASALRAYLKKTAKTVSPSAVPNSKD